MQQEVKNMNNVIHRDEIGITVLGEGVKNCIEYLPNHWRLPGVEILREEEMY